jgi:ATP-dependent DNA helicase DinG
MARLVARGLRLGRHALIQVPAGDRHRLSYLLPAFMWPGATLVCAPRPVQEQLIRDWVPLLREGLSLLKPVLQANHLPAGFQGVVLVEPQVWLRDRLQVPVASDATGLSTAEFTDTDVTVGGSAFPSAIPAIIDGAEYLETWVQQALTVAIASPDWQNLILALPEVSQVVQALRQELMQKLLRRPLARYLLHADEVALMDELCERMATFQHRLPSSWRRLCQFHAQPQWVLWAERTADASGCTISCSPVQVSEILARTVWPHQPVVLVGEALDVDKSAASFRQRLGLPDLTPLQFLPSQDEVLPIYTPTSFPPPNSPLFRDRLLVSLKSLLARMTGGAAVILVSDRPLQAQVGAALAAEFGSRVRVNGFYHPEQGILVCSWEFWLERRDQLPAPSLLAIATLPFPSMEDPLVSGRVTYLKQQRQDWFRSYLLPVAASQLQRAVAPLWGGDPLRRNGLVAILDIRIVARSYGQPLLDCLTPTLRVSERELASLELFSLG